MALIRDASKVQPFLEEVGEKVITKKACKIQVPARFADIDLAQVGIDTYVYAIYALIMEDGYYAVSNVNTMIKIEPAKTTLTKINGVPYYDFHFNAGSTLITTTNAVRRNLLIYNVINELEFKGKVPWFMDYDDIGKLFDTATSHADSRVNANLTAIEILAASLGRQKDDRLKYYRTMVESREWMKNNPPAFVGLENVHYGVTNTMNKLAGAHFDHGVVSALVNPTTEVQHIEQLLRA